MPIYEYKHVENDVNDCDEVIEVFQNMSAAPLERCPKCMRAIKKMISVPCKHQDSVKNTLSDSNLSQKGFSKYVKTGDGTYEKMTGPDEAPATLDKKNMKAGLQKMGLD
jgi:hypothetical protein